MKQFSAFLLFKVTMMRHIAIGLLALGVLLDASPTLANPVAIALMEGYSLWAGQGNTIGINSLNTAIRERMAGENYFSRVFDWDNVNEVRNYFNLFDSSTNYLIGYSRGGYQALRAADALRADSKTIDRLIMLDPVRCGGTGAYEADNVLDCARSSILQPVSSIYSTGPMIVPSNVTSVTNYYQTGGGITGERDVTGALNVNVNTLFSDPSINHSTIDDHMGLRGLITSDIHGARDNSVLMTNLGGSNGFGTLAMTPNDDGSTDEITLPFSVNLNGNIYTSIYINNNGNITLDGPYGAYTPTGFGGLSVDMIAPYWGDVDTRGSNGGEVYLAVPTSDVAVITWNEVGFYLENSSKLNTFQLILRDRNDLEGSNTDVEFRYDRLEWTTGDASGGSDGLGGQPAYAGYSSGPSGAAQTLPGSGTGDILNLNTRSNIGNPGHWYFTFREGGAPGTTRLNPLLPDVQDDNWNFNYTTTQIDQIVWSDPEIVYGYDYIATGGINFRSFSLPTLGDNWYELWLGDPTNPLYIADIMGGTEYFFSNLGYASGVDFFRILGVETSLGIDPNDVTAFVTGLSFTEVGYVTWTQRPLAVDLDSDPVPEPSTLLLLGTGLVGLVAYRRRSA